MPSPEGPKLRLQGCEPEVKVGLWPEHLTGGCKESGEQQALGRSP